MVMAQVIHEKGGPENFVWEEVKLGSPGPGEVRIRNDAIGVNFADTYHRAGIPHPLVVGDPPVIVGFESVSEVIFIKWLILSLMCQQMSFNSAQSTQRSKHAKSARK